MGAFGEVAGIIFEQIGARRMMVMTGTKLLVDLENGLRVILPSKSPTGATGFDVVLTPDDTYTVRTFALNRRTGHCPVLSEQAGVYAEDLRREAERMTGLRFSL